MFGLAVGCLSGCERGPKDATTEPALPLQDCVGAGIADAKCGILSVEEDRTAPGGRQIELPIFVAPATSRTPAADPVFLLAGGPGQGAAQLGPQIAHKFEAIRRDRAVVFVDLRGTGGANPLRCVLEDPDDLAALLGAKLELDELDACLAGYGETDLRQYTTDALVEDLEAARAALGYAQINLLGISYGSRLALEYMRRYPERTRSAVLDGVVPPDLGLFMESPAHAEAALDRVLDDCRSEPECAAAFPGLERKLAQVLADLDENRALERLEHPRTGAPMRVEISRPGFVAVLRAALYGGVFSSLIPRVIDRAHAGDYGPLAALALHSAKMLDSVSVGLYLSVVCSEDLRELDERSRARAVAGLTVFDDHALAQLEQVCARWPRAALADELFAPVSSSVPTLLLSGRYDPVTPPAMAERVGATLSDARHVIADNLSHGLWHQGCVPELLAEFYRSADPAGLDASCVAAIPRPRTFLGANGPRSLAAAAPEERPR